MKLSIRKRNTLRRRNTHNIRKTLRKKNKMTRSYRKIHTGGENTVWSYFDKIKWKYSSSDDLNGNNEATTVVQLKYDKDGSWIDSNRTFDITFTSNDGNNFKLDMKRLNIIGNTHDKTLNLSLVINDEGNNYTMTYKGQSWGFRVSSCGSVYSFYNENGQDLHSITIFNDKEKYIFKIDHKNLSNYAFFLSLIEQMYKMYLLHKSGNNDPIPSFFNMLVIKNDNKLLQIIRSNLNLFINQIKIKNLVEKESITTQKDYRQYDGIKPELTQDMYESYWRGAQIMECFKNRQFNFDDNINNVFSLYLNSTYDAKEQTCNTKEESVPTLPFQCIKKLGEGGKIGTPYIVTIEGKNIIMKITKDIKLNINVMCSTNNPRKCETCKQLQTVPAKINCFPKTHEIQHIVKSSEYINETIIGYVLNTIFFPKHNIDYVEKLGLNDILEGNLYDGELGNSVYQIGHFQSNDKYGANLMEQADAELDKLFNILDKDKKPDETKKLHENEHFMKIRFSHDSKLYLGKNPEHTNIIIAMLLLQLSNTLKIVADELGMIHGDLKAGNVFFSIKDNYMNVGYPLNDKINIKTNIRLKIADYGKSSIIYDGVRFYCGSYITRFASKSSKANNYDVEENKYYSYKYTNYRTDILKPSQKLAHQLRHIKCPYYRSFDLYCVIISLAIQSKLFRNFYTDSVFDLRSALFSNIVHDPVSSFEFVKHDKPKSISTVFELLNHKQLSCNAIEDFINNCTDIFLGQIQIISPNTTNTQP